MRGKYLDIAKGQAQQDQEIAAGAAWMRESKPGAVLDFWIKLNNAEPDDLRKLSNVELQVIRSLALIGFFEIAKSNWSRDT